MSNFQPGLTLEQVEKEMILSALKFYGGCKLKAAQSLGITVRTIQNKLAQYNPKEKVKDEPSKDTSATA